MGKLTILDGGMGRELEQRGAPFRQPEWSALAMMQAPKVVKEVHKTFILHGAEVITTNSYALVPFHIGEERFKTRGRALAESAGDMARAAVVETRSDTRIAGSIPPLFGSYRPDLYQPERVAEIAEPLIQGLSNYADLWLCETQSLIDEPVRIKSLIDEMADALDLEKRPFWVSFTLEDARACDEPVLRSGETVADAVKAMVEIRADAILFNCCQPEVIERAIRTTRQELVSLGAGKVEIGAYANAFAPQPKDAKANEDLNALRTDLTPASYLDWAKQWVQQGATLIGGCCGIGPDHIAVLSETLVSPSSAGQDAT
ncbi:MAG: homocysteine S-methyltransferase family protein [Desulfobacterales bacterium]|nr:homocysteine S-methyltransferase family protein [Desulfobacterales bacterium]